MLCDRRVVVPVAFVLAGLLSLALLGGCASPDERHPAVIAMEELLQLRRDGVTDAERYAPYFAESSVATALAESGETTIAPVPLWEEPYVSAETTSSADVVVVWKVDEDHPDWPEATVFVFQLADGEWRISDALDAGEDIPEPLDTVDE